MKTMILSTGKQESNGGWGLIRRLKDTEKLILSAKRFLCWCVRFEYRNPQNTDPFDTMLKYYTA